MSGYDVAVVGAGVAGASAAYFLSRTLKVVVLEQEERGGYHSTGRSAASFTENYGNGAVRRLAMASREFLEQPPAGFAEVPLLSPRGMVTIARADQMDLLQAAFDRARALLPTMEWMTPQACRELVPVLREDYLAGAFYEPDCRDIDVDALHQGYLRGFRQNGGTVLTRAEVTSLSRGPSGWTIGLPDRQIQAAVVVDAAGAWADVVATRAGLAPLGLQPKRRTALTIDLPAELQGAHWPMVDDVGEELYFKPDAGRLLVSPADQTPVDPCDAQPEELDVAIAVDRLEKATTLAVRRVPHAWAGLRTFAPDKSPVVGFDPRVEGLFWLAGQGGYGIKTSPALGQTAASLITGKGWPELLAGRGLAAEELSPARFLSDQNTHEEAKP